MKLILLSQSDNIGGAARASLRLHRSLLAHGVENHMLVGSKKTDFVSIEGSNTKLSKIITLLRPYFANLLMRLQQSLNSIQHSPAVLPSGLLNKLNASSADILNLHWINKEFLTVEDIGSLRKPIVWTLHDMWAFCGAEHYAGENSGARWRSGYFANNRLEGDRGLDIDRWVWQRKLKAWDRQMHIITPSHWLANCVKASALFNNRPVTVIPNLLDTQLFQPWPKSLARQIFGLSPDAPLILFGAIGGGDDPRKGWDLLQPALAQIANGHIKAEGVIFGQSAPKIPPNLGIPLHWIGHLNDDITLSLLYSAADVMIVPSRQENLPQAGTEAQACGCPVVTFNCTGMPDVVTHEETGYLAKPYESADLAKGIIWILENPERYKRLSFSARTRALRLWSPDVVIPQYLSFYQQAIDAFLSTNKFTRRNYSH